MGERDPLIIPWDNLGNQVPKRKEFPVLPPRQAEVGLEWTEGKTFLVLGFQGGL